MTLSRNQVNGTWILKSGTDFRQFSLVELDFSEDPVEITIEVTFSIFSLV
jgi:hypothetical protein